MGVGEFVDNAKFEKQLLAFLGNQEQVDNFKKLSCNEDMVEALYHSPAIQEMLKISGQQDGGGKSEGETKRCREAGNKHFQAGRDEEALKQFNRAVVAAPVNAKQEGRDLSIALANRSAVLFRLGYSSLAIRDIDMALEAGYPLELRFKVYERKYKCLLSQNKWSEAKLALEKLDQSLTDAKTDSSKKQSIQNDILSTLEDIKCQMTENPESENKNDLEENSENIHKLVEINPKSPAASDCIQIKYEEDRGRFAVARRDIAVGTVLLIEDPAVCNLKPEYQGTHCDVCLRSCQLSTVPCSGCAKVSFCSKACRDKAAQTYHQYECGTVDFFKAFLSKMSQERKKEDGAKNYHTLSYRAVAQKPFSWLKENKSWLRGGDCIHGSAGEDVMPASYTSMVHLVSHHERRTLATSFWLIVSGVFHLRTLQAMGYFGVKKMKPSSSLTEDEKFVGGLLVNFLELMQFNTHGVTESVLDRPGTNQGYKSVNLGCAVYPTLAMFNHSCDHNIDKYMVGSKTVVLAAKNIKAGEEITENYFPCSSLIPRPERRSWLAEHYWFDCGCNPCRKNQPMTKDMPQEPLNLRCVDPSCSGVSTSGANCPVCGSSPRPHSTTATQAKEIVTAIKDIINKVKVGEEEGVDKAYAKVTELCCRLQDMVAHPYQGLSIADSAWRRLLRLNYGNKSYNAWK